ncbi:MAG TPA: hypothetical protein VJ718_11130, partial [Candidatus Binataceae bacterium]|nr:hypothetical protein [Candidatus Binataceae bacterium]
MSINSQVALAILGAFAILGILSLMGAYLIIGMAWDKSPLRLARRDKRISGKSLVWRALMLRCPACGEGRIFNALFRMSRGCAVCGAAFWKNEGEWLGPAVIDYSVATGAALVAWAFVVLAGGSAAAQLVWAGGAAVVAAIALSRWSR